MYTIFIGLIRFQLPHYNLSPAEVSPTYLLNPPSAGHLQMGLRPSTEALLASQWPHLPKKSETRSLSRHQLSIAPQTEV